MAEGASVAGALVLEHLSLTMNPRGIHRSTAMMQITKGAANAPAIQTTVRR